MGSNFSSCMKKQNARTPDSPSISLLQMPKIPMEHILEHLDFQSILVLRKVCHDLRNFIDDTKPASRLTKILINPYCESINFYLYLSQPSSPLGILYEKTQKGCLVECDKDDETIKKTTMKNEDFVTLFRKNFDIVLRHQKTVLEELKFVFYSLNSTTKERILEGVTKSLKSINHPLQVKSLFFKVTDHNEILSILPYIDPNTLEKIVIYDVSERHNNVLNLVEIGQLEQWKQAKQLEIHRFLLPYPAQNLTNFSTIKLNLKEISTEELILLKEMFLCSSTLSEMRIYNYGELSQDKIRQKLIELFGQPFVDSYQYRNWFFKIPDINQLFRITMDEYSIDFNRIEQSDVPRNAIILN